MNAIRFIGAVALAGTLAGCAGTTSIDPGASVALKQPAAPVKTAKAPALPERVAPAPERRSVPTTPIAPYRSAPPAVYVPQTTVTAPPVPAPVQESLPRYEPVETVTAAIPEPVTIPEALAQPVYEPVEIPEPVTVTETVRVPEPDYTPVGDLDAPAVAPKPVYEAVVAAKPAPKAAPPARRSMAPIRDDPQDGRNGRRVANSEIRQHARKGYRRNAALRAGGLKAKIRSNFTPAFGMKLEQAALARINPSIRYDARYVPIGFPWGDVDEATGVCTDVVIRSYRKLGIDLQELVHEDMKRAFRAYPSKRIYGLKKADPNIDHRRVVNLEAFFERTGAAVPIGSKPDDFIPGDVLTWRLSGNEPHIGIVVSDRDPRTGMPLVVHNLGAGVRKEDLISLSPPVGHFRFAPDRQTVVAALVTKR